MNSDSSRNNNIAAGGASASPRQRKTNILKEVKFDQVFIHEFPIILGDNPAVSKGAPITIDWKPITHDVIDLDIYEYLREPERRHRKRMIMSNSKRAKLLMNAGYSIDDIAEMTLQVEDAKRVRAENALDSNDSGWLQNMKNGNIMELLSGAAEGTGRTLFIAAPTAVFKGANKVGYEVVKGTGKVVVGTGKATTAVVVGTGKLVATTGKVSADLAVGTVKGTGKVVVGAGKATTAVVVGTGKLGYDVVRSSGKLMSNLFNGSIADLGYENPDAPDNNNDNEAKDDPLSLRSSPSSAYRRGSNDSRDSRRDRRASLDGAETYAPSNSIGKGTPAPQRMPRRGSANNYMSPKNGEEQQASNKTSRSNKGSSGSYKSKRRGSGSGGALAGSFSNFTNIFTGRGVRRTNSSTPVRGSGSGADNIAGMDGSERIRTKSTDGNNNNSHKSSGGRRRRATMTAGGPISPRLTKSANAATTMQGSAGISELAQMEQFLNFVRDSEPATVNPIIGNAYSSADDDYDTPSDDEDDIHSSLGGSGGSASGSGRTKTTRRNSIGRGNNTSSSPQKALSPTSTGEAITPAA